MLVGTPATLGLFVLGTNGAVLSNASGKIYTSAEKVPAMPVALVLGTSPKFQGHKNLFFERRMDAAAQLYKARKVGKLLVSGDNGTRYYDEPTAMKKALLDRGVAEKDIALDYAGFRTLDSVVRAHRVFGIDKCIIVTDDFHLPRALYVAENENLHAIGFQTQPIDHDYSPNTYRREVFSRSLAWLELHVLNTQPKFLGKKETL